MKAFRLVAHGTPGRFEVADVPDLAAGPDEVVVRVRACGLNRLDLWTEEGALPVPIDLPRVLGGEISGDVLSVGSGVTDWRVGDRVAVQSNIFCGKCEFCQRGQESICIKGKLLGVQLDGGFAEQVLVPATTLVRLPDKLGYAESAGLTLAGSTAMHMLTQRTQAKSGDWILVMGGASGVGSVAIQIAKQLGAKVISTGSSEEKRSFAKSLGADYVVDSTNEDWAADVRQITGKRGVDIVVEHIGGDVLLQCFNCLARGGSIVTCGATAGRDVSLKLWPLFVKEQKLIGSYGRTRNDIQAVLEWAAEGKIKPATTETFPLQKAAEAFAALRGRRVMGKVVVQPN